MCSRGLHGLAHGVGEGSLLNWSADALWWVVDTLDSPVVDLAGKVKFQFCQIVFRGDRKRATEYIVMNDREAVGVVGILATAGDGGTATAGYRGAATAGDGGTATAGYRGAATAGDRGAATAGDEGTATAGYRGTATAGDRGTATAGYGGILNIRWWDGKRYRIGTFYVGEDGIEPGVAYRCENGKAVKVNLNVPTTQPGGK